MPNYTKCPACVDWKTDVHKFHCKCCNNFRRVRENYFLCNLCGESLCYPDAYDKHDRYGLVDASAEGHYSSYHLTDMTEYSFSLCEKCLRQLFNQFKIKPQLNDRITSTDYSWEDEQKGYEYLIWKDNGGHHAAYLNGKCNFEKDCSNDALYSVFIDDEFTEGCCCERHKPIQPSSSYKLVDFVSDSMRILL